MWLRVLWYSIGITAVFAVAMPGSADQLWRASFLPVTHGMFWYFSSYVLMMLFLPLVNSELSRMSSKRHGLLLAMMFVLIFISSMGTVGTDKDPFGLFKGFSAMWLLMLGMLGGWLKRIRAERLHPALALCGYFFCTLISWGEKLLRTGRLGALPWDFDGLFIQYTSLMTTGAAVFLLLFFARLRISGRAARLVSRLSALSFSVYIIHTHPLMSEHLLTGLFAGWSSLPPLRLTVYVCAAAVGIYLLFSLVDLPRDLLFRKLKIPQRLRSMEQRLRLLE